MKNNSLNVWWLHIILISLYYIKIINMNGICFLDVINVVNSLGLEYQNDVLDSDIEYILERYSDEQKLDPTATWDLVVENLIYERLNDTKEERQ